MTGGGLGAIIDTGNGALVAAVVAVAIYLAVLWIAVAFWMVRDARRRSDSLSLAMVSAVLGLVLPYVGVLIYLVVRPPRTLDEERALLLEEQALAEDEPGVVTVGRPCPTCGREIEAEFIICPYCRTQFARRCGACARWLRLGWHVCPYCAEEVGVQSLGRPGRAS